jgi:aminoglycoside phosphotransferase (APT) family kinase protein
VLQIRHRLVIRHPSRPAVLVVSDAAGWRLPAFVSDDRHTAEVDYINRAVRERWGLSTTVLRSLRHSDPLGEAVVRTHELQAHGDGAPLPPGTQWCGRDELSARAGGEDEAVMAECLAVGVTPRVAVDGREWTLPGWFEDVCGWLERALAETGVREINEIVQLRAWASSCVLFVRTGAGDFYFKAVAESIRREGAVTAYLGQHFPDAVARIVATKPERRWFLMMALQGRRLEDIGDVMVWERAATAYARLQLACVARRRDLHELGCPTRGLDALAAEIEPLGADVAALRLGEPDGLSASEVDRLRARAPELRRRCERLADDGIPLTIEHGDLWPGNFLVDDATCAIIDWEDVAIGHPFVSLAPLIVGLRMFQPHLASPEVTRRLEGAYVAGLAGLAPPERLREGLRLAAPLSFVDMTVRYRDQRPSVVRLHPWMRDLVPLTLRLALAQLDAATD